MKQMNIPIVSKPVAKEDGSTHFNITAITDRGSSVSTQVFSADGDPYEAIARVSNWIEEGRNMNDVFARPLIMIFIHATRSGKTYQFLPRDFPQASSPAVTEAVQ